MSLCSELMLTLSHHQTWTCFPDALRQAHVLTPHKQSHTGSQSPQSLARYTAEDSPLLQYPSIYTLRHGVSPLEPFRLQPGRELLGLRCSLSTWLSSGLPGWTFRLLSFVDGGARLPLYLKQALRTETYTVHASRLPLACHQLPVRRILS